MPDLDLLVIGAGVAGATAARAVADAGATVLVLEKSRGLGGRCATRRTDDGLHLDHGAQYVTARDPGFRGLLASWRAEGDIAVWMHGVGSWTPETGLVGASDDGHPRYVAPDGMSRIGSLLLGDVPVERGTRVISVRRDDDRWRVTAEDGGDRRPRAVLATAPAAQTLDLLERTEIDPQAWDELASVRYAPSFALMARYAVPVPAWRGVKVDDHPVLAWLAHDGSKRRTAPAATTVVAHVTPAFARARFDDDREAIGDAIERAVAEVAGLDASPTWRRVHRWRYAQTEAPLDARSARLAPGLHAAGDGFGAGRVEGAYLSGLAAAERLLADLGPS